MKGRAYGTKHCNYLTDAIEDRRSSQTDGVSAGECVAQELPLFSVLNQKNRFQTLAPSYFIVCLNVFPIYV
jgi:hypothetical protein